MISGPWSFPGEGEGGEECKGKNGTSRFYPGVL